MTDTFTITRDQLYEKVWSQPAIAIAKEFGISDVAVAKICKKLDVPKPKLGYWAKKQHGKWVKQSPLPPLKPGTPKTYEIHPTESVVFPSGTQAIIDQRQDFESKKANRITVKTTLHGSHHLVSQTSSNLSSAYTDTYNRLELRSKGLDILVTKDSTRRALLIMDALLKALEKRGHQVTAEEGSTSTLIQDRRISFGITEAVKRIELTEGMEIEYSWEREWEYLSTGKLTLEIKERFHGQKVIKDGKIQRLEDCLNRFVLLLVKAAEIMKIEEVEREARWREYEKQREIEQIQQRKRELERVRTEQLFKSSTDWQQCQMMRSYLSAVKANSDGQADLSEIQEWIEWATGRLDMLESKLLKPELVKLKSIRANNYW